MAKKSRKSPKLPAGLNRFNNRNLALLAALVVVLVGVVAFESSLTGRLVILNLNFNYSSTCFDQVGNPLSLSTTDPIFTTSGPSFYVLDSPVRKIYQYRTGPAWNIFSIPTTTSSGASGHNVPQPQSLAFASSPITAFIGTTEGAFYSTNFNNDNLGLQPVITDLDNFTVAKKSANFGVVAFGNRAGSASSGAVNGKTIYTFNSQHNLVAKKQLNQDYSFSLLAVDGNVVYVGSKKGPSNGGYIVGVDLTQPNAAPSILLNTGQSLSAFGVVGDKLYYGKNDGAVYKKFKNLGSTAGPQLVHSAGGRVNDIISFNSRAVFLTESPTNPVRSYDGSTVKQFPANFVPFRALVNNSQLYLLGKNGSFWAVFRFKGDSCLTAAATGSGTQAAAGSGGTTNHAPTVTASANASNVLVDQHVKFTATASDQDAGQTLIYRWAFFGSGSVYYFNGTEMNPSFTLKFFEPGTKIFQVNVTDNGVPRKSALKNVTVVVTRPNRAPAAGYIFVTPNSTLVPVGTTVKLETAAYDLDHDALSYEWTQVSGPLSSVQNAISGPLTTQPLVASYTLMQAGNYTFKFTVRDNATPPLTATRFASVLAGGPNTAPQVTPMPFKLAAVNTLVNLSVAASDLDGNLLSFKWTPLALPQPFDVKLILSTPPADSLVFNATLVGNYTFNVNVTDNGVPRLSKAVNVTIGVATLDQIPNTAPALAVLPDVNATLFTPTQLNAPASDAEGNTLSFNWTQVSGPNLTNTSVVAGGFANSTVSLNFTQTGIYKFLVIVTDNGIPPLSAARNFTVFASQQPANASNGSNATVNASSAANATSSQIECQEDRDCAAGETCVSGSCYAAAPPSQSICSSDDDCTVNQRCFVGVCEELDCNAGETIVDHTCVALGGIQCGGTSYSGQGACCNNVWVAGVSQCPAPIPNASRGQQLGTAGGQAGGGLPASFFDQIQRVTQQPSSLPLLAGVVVALALVLGLLWFFLIRKKPPSAEEPKPDEEKPAELVAETGSTNGVEEPPQSEQ